LRGKTESLKERIDRFNPAAERAAYRDYMLQMQGLVGETVIMD
jgi:hypothetical protein